MKNLSRVVTAFVLFAAIGCGQIPGISENRKNFPPWEKLPEGNGISYIEKFTRDSGHDPIYLAKIKYDDDAALQRVLNAFGFVPHTTLDPPSSYIHTSTAPSWYPLKKVTHIYIFPKGTDGYLANLWVNADEKTMIIERSWY